MDLIEVPCGRQTYEFDCGAKALQILMAYYGLDLREDQLIRELKTDGDGTRVKRMISVAKKHGFDVSSTEKTTLRDVKKWVDEKTPVIVLLQAWAPRRMTMEDWRKDYDDGHFVIVIGYTSEMIVFEDPASFRRTWLSEREFLIRWHDRDTQTGKKIRRFSMVLRGHLAVVRDVLDHMD